MSDEQPQQPPIEVFVLGDATPAFEVKIGSCLKVDDHVYVVTCVENWLDYKGRSARITMMEPMLAMRAQQDLLDQRRMIENSLRVVPKVEKQMEGM